MGKVMGTAYRFVGITFIKPIRLHLAAVLRAATFCVGGLF